MASSNDTEVAQVKPAFLPFLATDVERKAFGIFIFILAGFCEIGGGYLVWQTIREHKQWWLALVGSLILIAYGFIATLQPINDFARVYAIYGAFFIVLSILWGLMIDGFKPDVGDILGTVIVIVGASVIFFWRR